MIETNQKLSTKFSVRVNNSIKMLFKRTRSFFYSHCALCSAATDNSDQLCNACCSDLVFSGHQCGRCALPLSDIRSDICNDCRQLDLHFEACLAGSLFELPMSLLIHRFKYFGERHLRYTLTRPLIERIQSSDMILPDLITCIPMHTKKQKERGFNGALLLARTLSEALNRPLEPSLIKKTNETNSQAELNRADRLKNLRQAFKFNSRFNVRGKHVAIVDDVVTTGATAEAAARVLKDHGAARVTIWCAARTPKPS